MKNPTQGPPESSGFALWHATQQWRAAIGEGLDPFGLTPTQFFLLTSLRWLSRAGDAPRQSHLAQHTGFDPMTTSQVLRTLEARKLLDRRSDPRDTRALRVVLTDEGTRVSLAAARAVEAAEARFFAPLGDRRAAFTKTLRAIAVEAGAPAHLFQNDKPAAKKSSARPRAT